ncbi:MULTISPECIES: hypothetical protein [Aerosakkonema]
MMKENRVFWVYGRKCLYILQMCALVGYGTATKLSIESAEIVARA